MLIHQVKTIFGHVKRRLCPNLFHDLKTLCWVSGLYGVQHPNITSHIRMSVSLIIRIIGRAVPEVDDLSHNNTLECDIYRFLWVVCVWYVEAFLADGNV